MECLTSPIRQNFVFSEQNRAPMKIKLLTLIFLSLILFACRPRQPKESAATDTKQEFACMKWLQGTWKERNDSAENYQEWTMPNDTTMQETGWTKKGSDSSATEKFLVQREDDGIIMSVELAEQEGAPPSYFHLVSNKNGEHVFEDQNNNYPQRLILRLNPDGLLYYRQEGIRDGQSLFNEQIMNKIK